MTASFRLSRAIRSPLKILYGGDPRGRASDIKTAQPNILSPPPTTAALPKEIWENIFYYIDAEGFRAAAAVCRVFNELAGMMYLVTRGVPRESLITGKLEIASPLILALNTVMGASLFFPPTVTRLAVQFYDHENDFGEHLRALGNVVLQCPKLEHLDLRFPQGAFCSHSPSETSDGLTEDEVDQRCNWFHDIMLAMAQGPVVCIDPRRAFCCQPLDLCTKQFAPNYLAPRPRTMRSRNLFGLSQSTQSRPWRQRIPETDPNAAARGTYQWPDVKSVAVRRIRSSSDAHPPYTLVLTNEELVQQLHLGRQEHQSKRRHLYLSGGQTNRILPHLTLRHLRSLVLHTEEIDPEILGQFLMRHETLEKLRYSGLDSGSQPSILATPQVNLPGLKYLGSDSTIALSALLDAIRPSERQTISLEFPADGASKTELKNHRALLRQIAARRAEDTTLEISATFPDTHQPNQEEEAIARSLLCVSSVKVISRWDIACMDGLVPWLAVLPALKRVEFTMPYLNVGEAWDKLLDQASTALPNLPIVEKSDYTNPNETIHVLRQ
ncbi:hypothetical protein C8R47DRAFT_1323597 [Mycena vitilis]|nr:hypothetical protein C8R47DRAFT_1323597 [Mycena vitilis]